MASMEGGGGCTKIEFDTWKRLGQENNNMQSMTDELIMYRTCRVIGTASTGKI